LFLLCLILNITVVRSNPGFIERDPNLKFVTLLDSFEASSLCPDCQVIRTPRCRHCTLCKRCVDRFDHHCPWVNNCIGKNNFAYFYTFVFTQSVYLICLCVITVKYINLEFVEDVLAEVEDREDSSWYIWRRMFGVFWGLIAIFFMLSIMVLCYVSTDNLCKGETSCERFTK
jgi:palmitoyltransferase